VDHEDIVIHGLSESKDDELNCTELNTEFNSARPEIANNYDVPNS
jgi:hypothetical protein